MTLVVVAAWTVWPGSVALWTLFVVLTLAFPVYAHVTTSLLLHPRGIPWTSHFWSVWGDVLTNTAQVALSVAFLAHQAGLMADAVARTLWRKLVSRRRLLEWTTAAQAEQGSAKTAPAYFRFMWHAPALAFAACAIVLLLRPSALAVAVPLVLAWALSPLVAYRVSRRLSPAREPLSAEETRSLRLIARRTWRYFESFVGEEDNWLPPDNFQEDPRPVIAHRTSPTNAGLLLLSTVAAHDFGYTGTLELVERLSLTFKTLERLPRFRGHFFNWYDTRTLEALAPQYVSTVDSGNLVGHLLAVKQACVELPDGELFGARTLEGLADAVALAREEASRLGAALARTGGVGIKQLREELERLAQLVEGTPPSTLSGWSAVFGALARHASLVEDIVGALSHEQGEEAFAELRFWLGTLRRQTQNLARDLGDITRESFMLAAQLTPLISFCPADRIARWEETARELDATDVPARLAALYEEALAQLSDLDGEVEQSTQADAQTRSAARGALALVRRSIEDAASSVAALHARAAGLAGACQRVFDETDFKFLLDPERKVFRIGYNVTDARADNSFYDLFASESRLASFAAIAKGDVPQEHWFRLGRKLTPVDGGRALISWTGTMFEYLMPLLVMRDYERTLLHETYAAVVGRQIEYGEERGVPWGISESAYNGRDLQLNYQYAPFGVPGLGLKRGLAEDLVVAPYATVLAALVEPRRAVENLRRLEREGALARFGYYEAIDYTPERLPQNQKRALIRAFMAHHQGMSLVALDNLLNADAMRRRFHAEPLVQATELLLQERVPRGIPASHPRAEEVMSGRVVRGLTGFVTRAYDAPDLPTPRTQLLSNGTYSVMMTTAGAGYSACRGLAVTRWREDVTRDNYGSFFYLRDMRSGGVW